MTSRNRRSVESGSILPPPESLGLPARFQSWRKYQDDAILSLAASEKRFVGLVVPTGGGKSLTYMSYAKLSGMGRIAILTSTKSLQDQLERDFKELDVRGKNNYLCVYPHGPIPQGTTVEEGPCQSGAYCSKRDFTEDGKTIAGFGCEYYDRVKEARVADVVITNYAFWLANSVYGKGLGTFDLLVLDEAHAAPDELAGFLSASISERDAAIYLGMKLPGEGEESWWPWMRIALDKLNHEISTVKRRGTKEASERLKKLNRMAAPIAQVLSLGKKYWVAERNRNGMSWDITDPAPFADRFLFRETEKVILSSATVREKTLDLLGIDSEDAEMLEYPSTFPIERRPVYVVDGAPRMNFRTTPEQLDQWMGIIDTILKGRQDRRGVVHSVSFKRAKEIMEHSEFGESMVGHGSGSKELQQAIRTYLGMRPAILVSPSATTGVDLPYSDAEFQIITKIPFPDMRSKVLKARSKIDPDYPAYLAAQVMVQATGRGMRAEDDQQEAFIVDGNWGWFMKRYASFTPRWWRSAVKRIGVIPKAPKPLTDGHLS